MFYVGTSALQTELINAKVMFVDSYLTYLNWLLFNFI